MIFKNQYNKMYQNKNNCKVQVISCNGWPINRFEFAIYKASGGDVLCDIGCGGGEIIYNLKNKYKKFIGFEISDSRIELANRNCKDLDCQFVNDIFDQKIDLLDNSIDTAICLDVLDHMINIRQALKNIYRILKIDGQFILNVPNFARIDQRVKLLFGKFPSTSTKNEGVNKLGNSDLFDGGKLHYFTFNSLINLLREVGFEKIKKFGIGKYKKLHNIYPNLLSGSISLVCVK